MVVCLEQGADLHIAQLMPLPLTVSFFSKIQIGFTFLVPAHLGNPGKKAVKRVCMCVYLTRRRKVAWCAWNVQLFTADVSRVHDCSRKWSEMREEHALGVAKCWVQVIGHCFSNISLAFCWLSVWDIMTFLVLWLWVKHQQNALARTATSVFITAYFTSTSLLYGNWLHCLS